MSLSAKLGSLALGASGAQRCRALRCPPAAAAAPAARPRSVCVRAAVDVVAEEEDGPDAGRRRRPAPAGPGGREGGGRDGGPRKPREKPEFEERVVQARTAAAGAGRAPPATRFR